MTSAVLAGRQLSQLELDVLTACLHHRLLTSVQLRTLLAPDTSPRWMQMITSRLRAPDGDTLLTRFVELDRGPYSPILLRNKIRSSVELFTPPPPAAPGSPAPRPAWTRVYPAFPKVLVVFADQSATVIDRRIEV